MLDLGQVARNAQWTALFSDVSREIFWDPAFSDAPEPGRPKVVVVRDAVVLSNPAVLGVLREGRLKLFNESTPYPSRCIELRRLTFEFVQPNPPSIANFGCMAPLCCEWSDNFWHWMTECLPYALELERLGFTGCYLVPGGSTLFLESLTFFGIPMKRIVPKTADVNYIAEMYVADRADGQTARYPALIRAVRNAAARLCRPISKPRQLYIARRTRVVLNDVHEVIPILREHGFEAVYMEDQSLTEQIELACQSNFICGPHGAGLVAAMFMPDASRLLEFFAPTYINPCMLGVCESLDIYYQMIVSRSYREEPYARGLDIMVDLPSLRTALRYS